MDIVIITEGGTEIGMGHVYQSITLAEALLEVKETEVNIRFITKSEESVVDLIIKNKFQVLKVESDELIFDALNEYKPDRIIFDQIDISVDLARKIKHNLCGKLITLTNLSAANNFADITVLPEIGIDAGNLNKMEMSNGRVEFVGPKYWLLRKEFEKYQYRSKSNSAKIENILLIFGGSDPCNYTSKVLTELLKMASKYNITVILGNGYIFKRELNEVINTNRATMSNVRILEKISNVSEEMFNNDLVFTSPGLSFFEALHIGTPVVGFYQNDIQRIAYKGFLKTFGLKDVIKIKSIMETKSFVMPDDAFVMKMQIGRGKQEVVNSILKLN